MAECARADGSCSRARPRSCRRRFPGQARRQLLENDVVAVWNVSWLKQQYPLHTHRYDLVGDVLRRRRSHHHAGERARDGWSTPRPGCFRRIAPMSPTWRKARAIRRCARC